MSMIPRFNELASALDNHSPTWATISYKRYHLGGTFKGSNEHARTDLGGEGDGGVMLLMLVGQYGGRQYQGRLEGCRHVD